MIGSSGAFFVHVMGGITPLERGYNMRGRRSRCLRPMARACRARGGRLCRRACLWQAPGQVATEYALVVLVVVTIVYVAFHLLSPAVLATMNTVANSL